MKLTEHGAGFPLAKVVVSSLSSQETAAGYGDPTFIRVQENPQLNTILIYKKSVHTAIFKIDFKMQNIKVCIFNLFAVYLTTLFQ
jgi:hypothetical protein